MTWYATPSPCSTAPTPTPFPTNAGGTAAGNPQQRSVTVEALFIPTLSFWENGNSWYGSLGQARFFIQPQEGQLTVQLWRGPLTKELSEILAETAFPLSPEGLDQLTAWLDQQAEVLNKV